MIDLKAYKSKTKRLENSNQIVVLDEYGCIVQSCESIFDTTPYRTTPIQFAIPFLESVFEVISSLRVGTPEVLFSRIESPSPELVGYYDFTFSKIEDNQKNYILWGIYDFTPLYQDLIQYQQRYNEQEIYRQKQEHFLQLFPHTASTDNLLDEIIDSLRGGKAIQNAPIHLTNSLLSVFAAFEYQKNIHFEPIVPAFDFTLMGDKTWFKFLVYNLLSNAVAAFEAASVKTNIHPTLIDHTYNISFKLTLKGKTAHARIFQAIFNPTCLSETELQPEEQAAIAQLYSIQKIIHQQNGYLEVKPLLPCFQEMELTLFFVFLFEEMS
jgi:hypothetical protein